MAESNAAGASRLKVFVSYSRTDVDFADQLVLALEDKGFEAILDRHDIDAEKWKERLGALLFACDTVVFVLTDASAASPICRWEVEEAVRLRKRIIPVAPHALGDVSPPPQLAEINYIHFYRDPALPGSGFYAGVQKLERALQVDLGWLREQTRLSEQAALWNARMEMRTAPAELSSMLLRGNVLAEAFAWAARAPNGQTVPPLVSNFLEASAAAEAKLNAEAQAQIADREAALKKAEQAAAGQKRANKRLRAVSLVGLAAALLLIALAGWQWRSAIFARVDADERTAAQFAREAAALAQKGDQTKAMLMALQGDPSAQGGWERRWLRPDGFQAARTALVSGYLHSRLEKVYGGGAAQIFGNAFLSKNGKSLLGVTHVGSAFEWDIETGKLLRTLPSQQRSIVATAWSADETILATGDSRGTVTIRDAAQGGVIKAFVVRPRDNRISSIAFSADKSQLFVGGEDGLVGLWDTNTGALIKTFSGLVGRVSAIDVSPDGKFVAAGAGRNTVIIGQQRRYSAYLWRVDTGQLLQSFPDHEGPVRAIAFSANGAYLITGSSDRTVKNWGGSGLVQTINGHSEEVRSVAFSPDGRYALTADNAGISKLWQLDFRTSSVEIASFPSHAPYVQSAAFFPDQKRVLILTQAGAAEIWRVDQRIDRAPDTIAFGETELTREPYGSEYKDSVGIYAAAWSADGKRLATNGPDGAVTIWDATTGKPLSHLVGHSAPITAISFSPNGKMLISGGSDLTARIWDISTSKTVLTLRGFSNDPDTANSESPQGSVHAVAFSPDGRTVALSADEGALQIRDAATGNVLRKLDLKESTAKALAFSPDGKRLVSGGSDNVVRVWDTASGQELKAFQGRGDFHRVAFIQSGQHVFAAGGQETFVWDVGSGAQLNTTPETEGISAADVSGDGRLAVTGYKGNNTGGAHIRSSTGGDPLATLNNNNEWVESAAISPDGTRVFLGSMAGGAIFSTPSIIHASPRNQVELACKRLAEIGMTQFTARDFVDYPILAAGAASAPCAAFWPAPPTSQSAKPYPLE